MIATGTPEQVAMVEGSHTGHFLAQLLPAAGKGAAKGRRRSRSVATNGSAATNGNGSAARNGSRAKATAKR